MTHYLELETNRLRQDPLLLIVPGIDDGEPQHWQTLWERQCSDCRRVDLGRSDNPFRNNWVNRLNLAIYQSGRPVVLVAHGLGCLAVAWWAEYERPNYGNPVVGGLLVAPPDVDRPGTDPRFARFAPCPPAPLPFPSFLAASHDDPFCDVRGAQLLARNWGCRLASAGPVGHIDAKSGLGDWLVGKKLLAQLLGEHRPDYETEKLSQELRLPVRTGASYTRAHHGPRRAKQARTSRTRDSVTLANDAEPPVALDARHA